LRPARCVPMVRRSTMVAIHTGGGKSILLFDSASVDVVFNCCRKSLPVCLAVRHTLVLCLNG